MSKFISICALFVFAFFLGLGGCFDEETENEFSVEVNNFDYGYVYLESQGDVIDCSNKQKYSSLEVDKKYYLCYDFELVGRKNYKENKKIKAELTFQDLNVYNGKVEETNSGSISELTFIDAGSGSQGQTTSIEFAIPNKANEKKNIQIIIAISPISIGESPISLSFSSDEAQIYGNSSDGFTKHIEIVKANIDTPVLTFNSALGTLSWNHVKGAIYYKFYAGNNVIKDENDEDFKYEVDSSIGAGMTITFYDLTEYFVGSGTIKIQAFGNANYNPSNYSNDVLVTI